jgi:hypothetical protein
MRLWPKYRVHIVALAIFATLCVTLGLRLLLYRGWARSIAGNQSRDQTLEEWINGVGRPEYKLLYATTTQGRHIVIFDAGNDTIAFCDSQSDPVSALSITSASGESVIDHSRKIAPISVSETFIIKRVDRDVGELIPVRHDLKGEPIRFLYKRLSEEADEIHVQSGAAQAVILDVELKVN